MSVRHVHAKPGEYIAVHRHRGGRSSGVEGIGCLAVIAFGFTVWFIVSYWKIILTCVIASLALWLIWEFRSPLWKAVCWISKQLWSLISKSLDLVVKAVRAGYLKIKNRQKKKCIQAPASICSASEEYNSSSADYGKIIQNRR